MIHEACATFGSACLVIPRRPSRQDWRPRLTTLLASYLQVLLDTPGLAQLAMNTLAAGPNALLCASHRGPPRLAGGGRRGPRDGRLGGRSADVVRDGRRRGAEPPPGRARSPRADRARHRSRVAPRIPPDSRFPRGPARRPGSACAGRWRCCSRASCRRRARGPRRPSCRPRRAGARRPRRRKSSGHHGGWRGETRASRKAGARLAPSPRADVCVHRRLKERGVMEKNTSVLVVGGGLVGLSTAMFLAWEGVPTVLVERHAGSSPHPRAIGFTATTMEAYRATGLAARIPQAPAGFRLRRARVESLAGKWFDEEATGHPRSTRTRRPASPGRRTRAPALPRTASSPCCAKGRSSSARTCG